MCTYNIYLITGDKRYKQRAKEKIEIIINKQSREGWFPEYGGADIGYLTVLIDYLAKYYRKTRDKKVKDVLDRALEFLKYFIHPNLTAGGEYGSRNTEYILPDGIEILSKENNTAKNIANAIIRALKNRELNLDDRYLCYNGYAYLQAYNDFYPRSPSINLPFKRNFEKYFPTSGLYICSTSKFYSIVGLSKGGAVKIFDKRTKKLVYDDCGIIGRLSDGRFVTTQWLDPSYKYGKITDKEKTSLGVEGKFHNVKYNLTIPLKTILSRSVLTTIGKSDKVSFRIKKTLREKMIMKSKTVPVKFHRDILFRNDFVTIDDKISIERGISFNKLTIGGKFSLIYIPSSRYFNQQELDPKGYDLTQQELQKLNKNKVLRIKRTVSGSGLKYSLE